MTDVAAGLAGILQGSYELFDTRLHEVPYTWHVDGMDVSGKFYYPSFRDGVPTIDEFLEYVFGQIVPFCIPRRTRQVHQARFQATNDWSFLSALLEQARKLFITARESQKTASELGELILFLLIERALKAPQLVCKMALKTNAQMPVHGSDAIHIGPGSTPDSVRIWWGESKLYEQLSSALDAVCESLKGFAGTATSRPGRIHELLIARDHASLTDDPEFEKAVLSFLDPYSAKHLQCEEAYACLVGFNFSAFTRVAGVPPNEVHQRFQTEYANRIASACDLFRDKLKANNLHHLRIHFFLVPFPNVAVLREKFFERLGATA